MSSPQNSRYPDVFIHRTALVQADSIGAGSKIWAFCNLLPGSRVGRACQICDRVFIEGGARLGDRVTVKCGVSIWNGVTLEDGAFIGPGVIFTNDPYPRSGRQLANYPTTVIRRYASLGAGAIILSDLEVGAYALVGAGSLVTHNVPDFALFVGNPARQIGWVCVCAQHLIQRDACFECGAACGRKYVLADGHMALVEGRDAPG